MAIFTAIRNKKQSAGVLRSVIEYVEQEKKTRWGDARLVIGHNCVPQSALTEMQMTKQRFRKTGGAQFYHFVQSFSADDDTNCTSVYKEEAQKKYVAVLITFAVSYGYFC